MELKPCPFCGSSDLVFSSDCREVGAITCTNCSGTTQDWGAGEAHVRKLWNTRANRWAAFTDEEISDILSAFTGAFSDGWDSETDIFRELEAELERRKATSV